MSFVVRDGPSVKSLIRERGLTQQHIAECMQVSEGLLSLALGGRRTLSSDAVARFVEALGEPVIPVDALFRSQVAIVPVSRRSRPIERDTERRTA